MIKFTNAVNIKKPITVRMPEPPIPTIILARYKPKVIGSTIIGAL